MMSGSVTENYCPRTPPTRNALGNVNYIDRLDPHFVDTLMALVDGGPCQGAFVREMEHQHEKQRNTF